MESFMRDNGSFILGVVLLAGLLAEPSVVMFVAQGDGVVAEHPITAVPTTDTNAATGAGAARSIPNPTVSVAALHDIGATAPTPTPIVSPTPTIATPASRPRISTERQYDDE
jgi:hypothetical protein